MAKQRHIDKTYKDRWEHPHFKNAYCFNRGGVIYTCVYSKRQTTYLKWTAATKPLAMEILKQRYTDYVMNNGKAKTPTIKEAIELFYKYHVSNKSVSTQNNYKNAFINLLPAENCRVDEVEVIRAFAMKNIDRMKKEGYSNTTINAFIINVRALFNYLIDEMIVRDNPISTRLKLQPVRKTNKFFTELELKQILEYLEANRGDLYDDDFIDITKLLILTGARISEIIDIKAEQIFDEYLLIHGKGSRDRVFPYYIVPEMKDILEPRRQKKNKIFSLKYGHFRYRWNVLSTNLYNATIGMPEFRSIHTVRKSVSNIFRDKGMSVEVRGLLLGHNIAMETTIYNNNPDVNSYYQLIPDFVHSLPTKLL